jgi:hypothetical protein
VSGSPATITGLTGATTYTFRICSVTAEGVQSVGTATSSTTATNTLHLLFAQNNDGNTRIHYMRSTDAGAAWSSATRVDAAGQNTSASKVALDNLGNPHIVFTQISAAVNQPFYVKSSDGGSSFSSPVNVGYGAVAASVPKIAVDSNYIPHVVFLQNFGTVRAYYNRPTTSAATTWGSSAIQVDKAAGVGATTTPTIAVDSSNRVHVTSTEDLQTWYRRSPNSGTTWETSMDIDDNLVGSSGGADIAFDSSANPIVMFRSSSTQAAMNKSSSAGAAGSFVKANIKTASTSGTVQAKPEFVLDSSDKVHSVWVETDGFGNKRATYNKYTSATSSWGTAKYIDVDNSLAMPSNQIAISIDGANTIHVVYFQNYDDGSGSKPRVMYTKSADSGATFSTPRTIDTASSNALQALSLFTCGSGTIHVVFTRDKTGGPAYHPYYVRSTDNGATFTTPVQLDPGIDAQSATQITFTVWN